MTAGLREPPPTPVVRAGPRRALRRSLVPAVLIGAFLSIAGAFGSQDMPIIERTAFMVGVAVFSTTLGVGAFALVGRSRRLSSRWWLHGAAAAAVMTIPMGLAIWTALQVVVRPAPPVRSLPGFMPMSFATSLFFCLWAGYANRQRLAAAPASAPAETGPRFLERLPPKLQGAELWAVEAEDHYLRLHTSLGQDLLLMRLSDAVAELEGLEGARTHRSWWVARAAIAGVERADGRATLTLKNGAQAPVSRTYARALRARGWL